MNHAKITLLPPKAKTDPVEGGNSHRDVETSKFKFRGKESNGQKLA